MAKNKKVGKCVACGTRCYADAVLCPKCDGPNPHDFPEEGSAAFYRMSRSRANDWANEPGIGWQEHGRRQWLVDSKFYD